MKRDPLKLRLRRIIANALTYLPWTCHAFVLAWGEIGGRNLLVSGLAPGAARQCMRDAAMEGECYCLRFSCPEHRTMVYAATRVNAASLRRQRMGVEP